MENKGFDMEKIKELQALFDEKFDEIKKQIEKQLLTFGELLIEETKINPNPQEFFNWFIDNHYIEILKKRRVPFYLDSKYIIRYCVQLNKETVNQIQKEKQGLLFSKEANENQPHRDKILELLKNLFENNITEELFFEILEETSDIVHNEQMKHSYNSIPKNKLNTKLGYLRFCYHKIYLINDTTAVRENLIKYLHAKFECFSRTEQTTTDKKFSEKPKLYPR